MKKSIVLKSLTPFVGSVIFLFGSAACEKKPSNPEPTKAIQQLSQIEKASAPDQNTKANPAPPKIPKTIIIQPQTLINPQQVSNQIKNIKISGSELSFTSTGRDPYFSIPQLDSMPDGAVVKIDITFPKKQMLQLFYQPAGDSVYSEKNSLITVKDSGRQTIEWKIESPLNGQFRLDPGTTAGEYIIHKVEVVY